MNDLYLNNPEPDETLKFKAQNQKRKAEFCLWAVTKPITFNLEGLI